MPLESKALQRPHELRLLMCPLCKVHERHCLQSLNQSVTSFQQLHRADQMSGRHRVASSQHNNTMFNCDALHQPMTETFEAQTSS